MIEAEHLGKKKWHLKWSRASMSHRAPHLTRDASLEITRRPAGDIMARGSSRLAEYKAEDRAERSGWRGLWARIV